MQCVTLEVEGEDFRVIIDGHHSYAAALADGVEPRWEVLPVIQRQADTMDAESFLTMHRNDDDYYDVATGCPVW